MPKYFNTPFAENGDRDPVPEASVDGEVSFDTGYTTDYELPKTNTNRKAIERRKNNGLYHGITENLKFWQENGAPEIVADDGTGSPLSYSKGFVGVLAGVTYVTLVDGTTTVPPSAEWQEIDLSTLNQRTIYVGSVAELEALSLPVGTNVYLTEDSRAGEFVVKTGTPPSDPQKGIYIVLANGNYAQRRYDGMTPDGHIKPEWFGAGINKTTEENQTAFQAILDRTAGATVIRCGATGGTYTIRTLSVLRDNTTVDLNGCTLKQDFSSVAAQNNDSIFVLGERTVHRVNGFHLKNGTLDGDRDNVNQDFSGATNGDVDGIRSWGAQNWSMVDVTIRKMYGHATISNIYEAGNPATSDTDVYLDRVKTEGNGKAGCTFLAVQRLTVGSIEGLDENSPYWVAGGFPRTAAPLYIEPFENAFVQDIDIGSIFVRNCYRAISVGTKVARLNEPTWNRGSNINIGKIHGFCSGPGVSVESSDRVSIDNINLTFSGLLDSPTSCFVTQDSQIVMGKAQFKNPPGFGFRVLNNYIGSVAENGTDIMVDNLTIINPADNAVDIRETTNAAGKGVSYNIGKLKVIEGAATSATGDAVYIDKTVTTNEGDTITGMIHRGSTFANSINQSSTTGGRLQLRDSVVRSVTGSSIIGFGNIILDGALGGLGAVQTRVTSYTDETGSTRGIEMIDSQLAMRNSISAANANLNSLFRDSADNVLKYKDSAGVVSPLY